ncbi:MAG: TolC family protein [Planctomycetota bacterium]
MRKLLAAVVLSICVFVSAWSAGCSTHDPMDSTGRLPSTPGRQFQSPTPEEQPKLPPAPETDEPLSLAQCITIAIHNNEECQIALHEARAAGARVGQALGKYWPQVEFSATSRRGESQVLTEVDARYLRTTHSATFQATQTLWDGGQREASLEAAKAGRRAAGYNYSGVLQRVALETAAAYFRLLAAQSRLEVARDTVEQRERHLQLARKRLEAGLGRRVEVLKAQARKSDARLTVVEERSAVRQQQGELAAAIGAPVNSAPKVKEMGVEQRQQAQVKMEKLLKRAAENRPRLQAAISQIRRARQQKKAQKARRWPKLDLNTSFGWSDTHLLPEERKEWAISLGVSVPIFSGFQTTYRIMEAKETLEQRIASYKNSLTDVKLEVWKRYSALLRAEESITAAEQFLQSARESLQATESQYQEGYASIVELIDAQTTLTEARNRKVTARLNWHLALARLRRAVGKRWPSPEALGDLSPSGQSQANTEGTETDSDNDGPQEDSTGSEGGDK